MKLVKRVQNTATAAALPMMATAPMPTPAEARRAVVGCGARGCAISYTVHHPIFLPVVLSRQRHTLRLRNLFQVWTRCPSGGRLHKGIPIQVKTARVL